LWKHLRSGIVGGIVAGAVILAGSAVAGSGVGSVFNLGQSNTVNGPSGLSGTTAGKQLVVANLGTASSSTALLAFGRGASPAATFQNGGAGPAVSLLAGAGQPPFTTNSAYRVANLNADKLDGIDSSSFAQTYRGVPGNTAGTAKTLLGSSAVNIGSSAALLTVPGLAHVDVGCTATQGYVSFGNDTAGDAFWDITNGDVGHDHFNPGTTITTGFAVDVQRYTYHFFVGTPGSVNGQTLLSITVFGTRGSPCLYTATALLQSNA
jgi:hypothetical protein